MPASGRLRTRGCGPNGDSVGRGETTSTDLPGLEPPAGGERRPARRAPRAGPRRPGNERGTVPSKPTSSTGCTFPSSTTQPPPRTWIWADGHPLDLPHRLADRHRLLLASRPVGSSTSIWGVRPSSSARRASWNPEITASDRISAATPSASPPAATSDRKLAKASRRVLRR